MTTKTKEPPGGVKCSFSEMVPVEKLVANPRNPNQHPANQIGLLAKILEFQGWRLPIVVSNLSGFIVRGHGRLLAAHVMGLEAVPVDYQDYENEAQEWADLVADNRIAELAELDPQGLKDIIEELDTGEIDLDLTGFDDEELATLMSQFFQEEEGLTDDDAIPEQVEPRTQSGDLWQLGDHRLLCGDSTKAEDVEKVTGGGSPFIMVTDPPYGVEYDADWRNQALIADGSPIGGRAIGKVHNDDQADWSAAWIHFPGSVAYVWHSSWHIPACFASLDRSGFTIRSLIIWAKDRFAISRGHYHWQHEPCAYAVRKGSSADWIGDRKQTTLWEISHHASATGHGQTHPEPWGGCL